MWASGISRWRTPGGVSRAEWPFFLQGPANHGKSRQCAPVADTVFGYCVCSPGLRQAHPVGTDRTAVSRRPPTTHPYGNRRATPCKNSRHAMMQQPQNERRGPARKDDNRGSARGRLRRAWRYGPRDGVLQHSRSISARCGRPPWVIVLITILRPAEWANMPAVHDGSLRTVMHLHPDSASGDRNDWNAALEHHTT